MIENTFFTSVILVNAINYVSVRFHIHFLQQEVIS